MEMGKDKRWNDNERRKTDVLLPEKPVTVPFRPPQI
jgi:hypothetical protein